MPTVEDNEESIGTTPGMTVPGSSRAQGPTSLHTAIGDTTRAVVRLLRGSRHEQVSFFDEPGEHVWTLRSRDGETLSIEVVWFEHWVEEDVPQEGRVVFSAECRLLDFADGLRAALDRLLEDYGLEGYAQRWVEHEFPVAEYARLKEELSREQPPTVQNRGEGVYGPRRAS